MSSIPHLSVKSVSLRRNQDTHTAGVAAGVVDVVFTHRQRTAAPFPDRRLCPCAFAVSAVRDRRALRLTTAVTTFSMFLKSAPAPSSLTLKEILSVSSLMTLSSAGLRSVMVGGELSIFAVAEASTLLLRLAVGREHLQGQRVAVLHVDCRRVLEHRVVSLVITSPSPGTGSRLAKDRHQWSPSACTFVVVLDLADGHPLAAVGAAAHVHALVTAGVGSA